MEGREADRIRAEYGRRDERIPADRYSLTHPHNLFAVQQKSRLLMQRLVAEGLMPLAGKTLLDIGCGDGHHLLEFITWGAEPSRLAGIDLLPERVARAEVRLGGREQRAGGPDLRAGDASRLPWPSASFDIVHQGTVFTSILDDAMRRDVAREIVRVLKPGGVLVWYDFLVNNPNNPNVRGVGAAEIRRLFPGCRVQLARVTLAPPIARRLVRVSWIASLMLERLRFLNTHYLGIVRKDTC